MNDKERRWLAELDRGPLYTSRTWWIQGMMAAFVKLAKDGLVVCQDRDGDPAHPTDDLALWSITPKGRAALKKSA